MPHLIALSALCLTSLAYAADAPPAVQSTLNSFIQAVEQAPVVAATRLRLLAAHAEHFASEGYSDPVLSVNPEHDPALARTHFGITHTEVLLSQPLARWGERDAHMLAAAALEEEAEADLAMIRGEVASDLARSLSERALHAERAKLAHDAVDRASAALAQLTAALATAPAIRAQQLWSLQSRTEETGLQASDDERQVADAEAQARSLLGLPATGLLPALALPEASRVVIDSTPAVRIARARQSAARAEELMATSRRRPQVTLTAGWEGNHSDGAYEGMISLSLPIHLTTYAAGEDAAHARAQAAEVDQHRARYEAERLLAAARRERAQADAAQELARRTIDRDNAELAAVATSLAGAATDSMAVSSVIDVLDRIAERRQALAEAESRAVHALAELWRLVPLIPGQPISGATP